MYEELDVCAVCVLCACAFRTSGAHGFQETTRTFTVSTLRESGPGRHTLLCARVCHVFVA